METIIFKKRKLEETSKGGEGRSTDSSEASNKKLKYDHQVPRGPVYLKDPWNSFGKIGEALKMFSEFGENGYQFNKSKEESFTPVNFLDKQPNISETSWSAVTTQMINVHRKYGFDFETLCLSINMLQRYLDCTPIEIAILKAVGATCLYVACKVVEKHHPKKRKFLKAFTNTGLTPTLLYGLEKLILKKLHCRLWAPTINSFLEYYSLQRMSRNKNSHAHLTREVKTLLAAKAVAALSMTSYKAQAHKPSIMAQSCLKAADLLMQEGIEKAAPLTSLEKGFLYQLMPAVFKRPTPQQKERE
ncbi:hypothetical protein XENTR_v10020516 [Xenopus tropicalis]|uniref:Cyclin-O protein B-like n=1 Tax=Xenopus tropicalis TaxID=8364 RepID=A0A803JY47_XENTR|nr:cyclin-O protein B-like [Xenopus tropicalis]XP_031747540.1 cyclin-O protein B-like [Xenopus tropicalis]KAE8583441.1 hypothetical protein XENTR_v10020516 [Xenopus tropicalis]|eukprot:XP_012824176.1 PREDICTED: cyclin-O protein B-like [Xenopus tropicalis]